MKYLEVITVLNVFCLLVNFAIGLFGILVILDARKNNKEFEKYIKEKWGKL